MLRSRLVAALTVVLVVASSAPVLAQTGLPSDSPASADRVVVPEVADVVVVPPRLSEQPKNWLPDPDVGRDGLVFGASVSVAAEDAKATFEGLPISVELTPGAVSNGATEGPVGSPAVSVGVVVADPVWASLVSPEVGLAVQVDLFVDGNTADLGARSATVSLDYSEVPLGYGAGIFERLVVFWVDDCGALPTGELVCGTRIPVDTQRLTRDRVLSFKVTDSDLRDLEGVAEPGAAALPVGGSGAPLRIWGWGDFGPPPGGWFVVGSSPTGPQGSFAATPQSVVADYQVAIATGFFEMAYPISVPPAFQGPQASVTLSYSSGSVNGLTMDRNTQASVIGLGWSYHPGSISRMLAPCSAVSGGSPGSGDLCPTPGEELFTLNLNGVGSRLIEVDATNRIYRLESEQFWELQLYTGASNGDSEGEYWVLRTPDGYSYQFGREEDSGYDSSQFVRVWVPSGGNPGAWCGSGSGVYCDKAYQWNLEKVTDPDGYTMEVFYTEEFNEYDSNGTDVSYIRSALPDYIVYGDGPTVSHHAKVDFVYGDRCFESSCVAGDAQDFPDTPVDLDCSTGDCTIDAPSFWTSKRLAQIDTYVRDFAAEGDPYVLSDRYELSQDFPTIPDDPDGDQGLTKLWLTGVQQLAVSEWSGDVDAVDSPATLFDFVLLPNRMTYLDWEWSNDAPLYMPRISQVINELGGVTTIEYGRSHDCYNKTDSYDPFVDDWPLGTDTLNDATTPDSNFRRRQCDEFLAKDPTQTSKWVPMRNWKVIRITEEGAYGNPDIVTTYDYRIDDAQGDPTTWPLWRWRENPFGGTSVWDDYRGHRRVKVIDSTGAWQIFTFYGGVSGDYEPTMNAVLSLTETFTTSDSVSHTDYEYLRGQTAEVAAYTAGGTMLTRTLTDHYAVETFSGKGTYFVRPAEVTETVFGSPNVTTSTEYTYSDSHGNPTLVVYHGTAGDDPVAEQTSWIQSSTFPRMWLPNERKLWHGSSAGTAGDEAAMVRYFYDGATSHTSQPTKGKPTKTRYFTQRDPSDAYVDYQVTYDATAGWPTAYIDPEGVITGFGYDADYGVVASKSLDDGGALELTTSFEVHPGRGLLVSSTDPNGQSDLYEYDELGRLVEYWNRTRAKGSTGTVLFSYTSAGGGAPAVIRQRPLVGGERLDSYTYVDGFGRTIQTQAPFDADGDATADERTVTSTGYDNLGRVRYQSAPYVNTYGLAGESWVTPDAQWLSLDGTGDRVSSSYSTALTGDIDLAARLRLADHTPTNGYTVLGQWESAAVYQSVRAGFDSAGKMVLEVAQNLGGQLLSLDGVGDYAEVASAFNPAFGSDLDWRIRVRPADWTPGTAETLMAMEGQELSPQRTATYNTGGTGSKASGTSHSIPITSAADGTTARPTLVVVLVQAPGNVSYSWPAGWTEMADYGDGDGSGAAAYKLFTGAVDDITLTTSGSAAPNYEWISYTDVGAVSYTAANHSGGANFDPPSHTASVAVDATYDRWLAFDSGRETSGHPTHDTPSGYTRRHERVGTTLMGSFFDRMGTGTVSTNPNPSSCCYWADAGVVGTMALHGIDAVYAWSAAFTLNTNGTLTLTGSNNSNWFGRISTAAVPGVTDDLTAYWLRVTWDGATGQAQFFYDDDSAQGSYTQIGGSVTGSAFDVVTTAAKLRVADGYGSVEELAGKVFAAEFRSAIGGTMVANPRFDNATEWNDGGPNTDAQGRSWALVGNSAIDANVIHTILTSTVNVGTAAIVVDNATDLSYRWTLDRDNGAGGADAKFWWRAEESDPWTQLGATVTHTSTMTPQTPSRPWVIGGDWYGAGDLAGRLYTATITNGIAGSVVASPHFDDPVEWPSTAAHTDDQLNTWTPAANAAIQSVLGITPQGVSLDGSGDYVNSNYTTAITGDLDIRAMVRADHYTDVGNQMIASQYQISGNQKNHVFQIDSTGLLRLAVSADGGTATSYFSTVALSSVVPDGTPVQLRVTFDLNNGSGNSVATFYYRYATTDPWTQLGAPVTGSTYTTLYNSTQVFKVGASNTSTDPFGGDINWVEWRNGINGTLVAAPHFDNPVEWPNNTPHQDAQGRTWTLQGQAAIGANGWLLDSYTRTSYDPLSRVVAVDAMSGAGERFDTETTYGTATNQTTVTTTDPEGRWVTHYANGFGQLVRVSEPSSLDTYYTYTPRGEPETVTDDDSNVTTISYDILGRKLSMTDPDMGAWTYGYDLNSRLTTQTDARGTTLSFVYDDLGRMTQRKQDTTVLAEWYYGTTTTNNVMGRLIKSRVNGNDSDAVVEYDTYNADGLLTSQDLIIVGTTYEADYTYFDDGALDDLTYPLVPGAGVRETVTTTYNGLGQPYDLVGGQNYVASALWTAQGQPSAWTLGDGTINRSWTYDPQTLRATQYKAGTSQLAGSPTTNLVMLGYQYDDSGNITRIQDTLNSSQYECYAYDTSTQLTDALTGNSTCTSYSSSGYAPFDHDYTYDNLHNIVSLDGPTYSYGTGNTSASGDAGPHAVTDIGTTIDFGYDNNGNRITKTDNSVTTGYTYNPENRLASVDLPDSDDVVFVYDADGGRVSRSHGTYSTTYVAGLMEIDRTGSTVTETRTYYTFAGTAVAVRTHEAAATTFLFQNHLGSTVAAYDDTNNTANSQYYYPYGAERHAVATLPIDQRYTGQTSDATGADSGDTGLYHYNARYYDPQVGAFAAADTTVPTVALSVGLNRYAYVAGNPSNLTDPDGHGWFFAEMMEGYQEAVLGPPAQIMRARYAREWQMPLDSGWSFHTALDVLGSVPGLEMFDIWNGLYYAWEGDEFNAGISFASALGGDALKGARYTDEALGMVAHSGDDAAAAVSKADEALPGLPSTAPAPAGFGSTGRVTPENLTEQLAMTEVRSAPAGNPMQISMNDARWPAGEGWVKLYQDVGDIQIHYVRNTLTGAVDDFKFS